MTGLVGRLDVDDEQVEPRSKPVDRGIALGRVVVVVPAVAPTTSGDSMSVSTPESTDQVHRGGHARRQPKRERNDGIDGWKP